MNWASYINEWDYLFVIFALHFVCLLLSFILSSRETMVEMLTVILIFVSGSQTFTGFESLHLLCFGIPRSKIFGCILPLQCRRGRVSIFLSRWNRSFRRHGISCSIITRRQVSQQSFPWRLMVPSSGGLHTYSPLLHALNPTMCHFLRRSRENKSSLRIIPV